MKYESSITSKAMANVKVTEDQQMDRPKTTCPDLLMWGHKNNVETLRTILVTSIFPNFHDVFYYIKKSL